MENASKALIIAASILVAIMMLSLLVYTFRRFGTAAKAQEQTWINQEIDAFNAKFSVYDTFEKYNENDSISLLQTLNTAYKVVTAVNDAISINDTNNNSYKYGGLEVQNSVEIIVDLGSEYKSFSFNKIGSNQFRYLVIEPNANVKGKHIYGTNSVSSKKEENVKSFKTSYEINIYNMLNELRTTKVITKNNKTYTIYKYYFKGETSKNSDTNKIDKVRFTLVKDKNF